MSAVKKGYTRKSGKNFWRELFIKFFKIFPYKHRHYKTHSYFSGWGFDTEMVVRVFYGINGFIPHSAKDTALLGFMEKKEVLNLLRKARRICMRKMDDYNNTKIIVEELRKKYPQKSIGR